MEKCPNCNKLFGKDDTYCDSCGLNLKGICYKCCRENYITSKYCKYCGVEIYEFNEIRKIKMEEALKLLNEIEDIQSKMQHDEKYIKLNEKVDILNKKRKKIEELEKKTNDDFLYGCFVEALLPLFISMTISFLLSYFYFDKNFFIIFKFASIFIIVLLIYKFFYFIFKANREETINKYENEKEELLFYLENSNIRLIEAKNELEDLEKKFHFSRFSLKK